MYIYTIYIYIHTHVCIYIYYIYIIDMYIYIYYIIYILYIYIYMYIYYRHLYLMIASSNLAASLLILYRSFSSLILSSALWSLFHVLSKRLYRKRNGLSDARVVSLPQKRIWLCSTFFV